MGSFYEPPAPGALVGGGDLDALVAMVPGALTDQELRDALRVADRLRARLDGVTSGLTGAFDARGVWSADGARSAGAWLAARCDVARGAANAEVRLARVLRDTPAVEAAALAGRIGREKVKALLWARQEGLEDLFAADEADLVRDVEGTTVARAWRYLRRWVDDARARAGVNEPDGPEPNDGVGGSKVTLDMGLEGRWFGTLDLGADDGEIVANAIDGLMDTWWKSGVFHTGDGLTMGERKARALVELVTRGTGGGPQDGTAKPLILALVDAATLLGFPTTPTGFPGTSPSGTDRLFDTEDGNGPAGNDPAGTGPWPGSFLPGLDYRPGGELGVFEQLDAQERALMRLCELSRSGPVSLATMQRLACEGTISPVVVGSDGDVLHMGREIRLFNRHQRRALRIRDGHCVFAGCSVPAEACIAHHLDYWENGGPTDIDNGALVCPFHHRRIHAGEFSLHRHDDGGFTTRRHDHTPIDDAKGDIGVVARRRRPPPGPSPPGDAPDPETDLLTRATRRRIDALIVQAEAQRAAAPG